MCTKDASAQFSSIAGLRPAAQTRASGPTYSSGSSVIESLTTEQLMTND